MLKALALPLALVAAIAWPQQDLETVYDPQKNLTTVRLPATKLAGEKDRHYSLSFSIDYSYPGKTPSLPERVNFEVVSVVKGAPVEHRSVCCFCG